MRNRTFFAALLIGALTVAGCSTVASPDTYSTAASVTAEATSEGDSEAASSTSSSEDTSATDQGSSGSSSGANFSEDLSLDIGQYDPDKVVEQVGMMHCCIRFNKKCMCYSTLDGDCSVCFPIKN